MHTGRLYSCFDFTGSSLRPKLSNRCFGSYSDIQLVCVDINIDSHNYNYLPANEIFGLRHYPCLSTAVLIPISPSWLDFLRRYFGISLTIKNKTLFIPFEQLAKSRICVSMFLASPRRGLFLMPRYPMYFGDKTLQIVSHRIIGQHRVRLMPEDHRQS